MVSRSLRVNIFLYLLAVMLFSSCQESSKSHEHIATEKKIKKGRIWSKVNIYQIPLTAEEYPLKGKVKSATYRYYTLTEKSGQLEKKFAGRDSNVYDEFGHLVDQTSWDENGKRQYKCTYAYDKDNKATLWHFITDYDTTETHVTFKYDEHGNIIEQLWADTDPRQSGKSIYKYDNDGNMLEEARYDEKGQPVDMTGYKYDSKGNQIEYISKDKDGKIQMKMTALYDENGYKTSGGDYNDKDSLVGKWTVKNDADGNALQTTYWTVDDKFRGGRSTEYDKMGNVLKSYRYKKDDPKISILTDSNIYEYDKGGNIVKETDYSIEDGKSSFDGYMEAEYTYHN